MLASNLLSLRSANERLWARFLAWKSSRRHGQNTAVPPVQLGDALLATDVKFVGVILGVLPQQLARILRAA
jgi:hypothetical protein